MGSAWVLIAESSSPEANITNANDAIWWAYVTITTVGYGDRYPVTTLGRIVGIIVMTTGVGIFATFAGYLSSKLLSPPEELEKMETGEHDFEKEMIARIDELKQLIKNQDNSDREIRNRLKNIEILLSTERSEKQPDPVTITNDEPTGRSRSGKSSGQQDYRSKVLEKRFILVIYRGSQRDTSRLSIRGKN